MLFLLGKKAGGNNRKSFGQDGLTMIKPKGNVIVLAGPFEIVDFHHLLAIIHDRIEKRGYQDVVLDFSNCTAAFAGPMVAICSQVCKFRCEFKEFELILPKKENLGRLFKNANWAYLIDPVRYEKSSFRGLSQVPITQFFKPEEQTAAVNSILDKILRSLTGIHKG